MSGSIPKDEGRSGSPGLATGVRLTHSDVSVPTTAMPTQPALTIQRPIPCACSNCLAAPHTAMPKMIARNVVIWIMPFAAGRSCSANSSGRMPYFDGPKNALCSPMNARTMNSAVSSASE